MLNPLVLLDLINFSVQNSPKRFEESQSQLATNWQPENLNWQPIGNGKTNQMAKITDRQMTAKPGASDKWLSEVAIWGHGSLVARITTSGERLFYFRYANSIGERITYPIGTYSREGLEGTMTLAEAGNVRRSLLPCTRQEFGISGSILKLKRRRAWPPGKPSSLA